MRHHAPDLTEIAGCRCHQRARVGRILQRFIEGFDERWVDILQAVTRVSEILPELRTPLTNQLLALGAPTASLFDDCASRLLRQAFHLLTLAQGCRHAIS